MGMLSRTSLGTALQNKGQNHKFITTGRNIRDNGKIPLQLQQVVRSPKLEDWFVEEADRRLATLPTDRKLDFQERQALLEMPNRYADGSMQPISLSELLQMRDLCVSPQDILDRAAEGKELLQNNIRHEYLGTAARGLPAGGASSRAAKWAANNPETAALFGLGQTTPRFLYGSGGRSLLHHSLRFSRDIAREIGKIFPNIIMTNSSIVEVMMQEIRSKWGNFSSAELENTVLFNQIVLPRMWVDDQTIIDKLYPAGHGDFPYLLALYKMAKTLKESGVKYLIFSNADESIWQADPVMISIAQEMFNKDHHMVIIGVENINNQFGGGFVKKSDGTQSLVETPRLPWEVVKEGKAPIALNTTFYLCDVGFMAAFEEQLMDVDKSLVVKEIPGRTAGSTEQIFGVDSWAGDVLAAVLNPAFIQFPRLNFMGVKDGSFITGATPVEGLGGRTYQHYVSEAVGRFPNVMKGLLNGDKMVAEYLHRNGYSYLPLRI